MIFDIPLEFLFCFWPCARPHAALLLYHLALCPLQLTHWRAVSTSSNSRNKTKKTNSDISLKLLLFFSPSCVAVTRSWVNTTFFVPDWPSIAIVYHRARCEFQNVVLSVPMSLIIRSRITLTLLESRMKNGELTRNNCYKLCGSGSLVTIEALKMIQRGGSYGTEP